MAKNKKKSTKKKRTVKNQVKKTKKSKTPAKKQAMPVKQNKHLPTGLLIVNILFILGILIDLAVLATKPVFTLFGFDIGGVLAAILLLIAIGIMTLIVVGIFKGYPRAWKFTLYAYGILLLNSLVDLATAIITPERRIKFLASYTGMQEQAVTQSFNIGIWITVILVVIGIIIWLYIYSKKDYFLKKGK